MKIGMVGIISNPVTSLNSHNGGWTICCNKIIENKFGRKADVLTEKDDWNQYDILIINEGVNYREGVYNFFGGVQDKTKDKLLKLYNFKGDTYSINEEVDYNHMCLRRKELISYSSYDFKIPTIVFSDESRNLILGDSHSISIIKDGYAISRNDGKTLFGFLKDPSSYYNANGVDNLITYFGNIDIRFHLPRQNDPIEATLELVDRYISWCKSSGAVPTCLLPIETEDRKIPGTGLYNGKPFYGSRELRMELVSNFNHYLKDSIDNCLTWPEYWYDKDYDFTQEMESRQSVHLKPKSYMCYDKPLIDSQLTMF